MTKKIGKIVIEMENRNKETFEVWHKEDTKILNDCSGQINPHYWVDYTPSISHSFSIRKYGLGQALRIINILKKSKGQIIVNTISDRVMEIAKREAILLRLE